MTEGFNISILKMFEKRSAFLPIFFYFCICANKRDRRTERQTHVWSLAPLTPTTKAGDRKRRIDRNQIKQKHFFMWNLEFRGRVQQ